MALVGTPQTPKTDIVLLYGIPFNNDYNQTIRYDNTTAGKQAWEAYLTAHTHANVTFDGQTYSYSLSEYMYQRINDNQIKVNIPKNLLENCNYMYINNKNFNGDTFRIYAFITSINYISNQCSLIEYEVDVIQTYFMAGNATGNYGGSLQAQFRECYVEREHVTDDTIGNNEVQENLPMGEVINREISLSKKVYDVADRTKIYDYTPARIASGMVINNNRVIIIQYNMSTGEGSQGGSAHNDSVVVNNILSGTSFVALRLRFSYNAGHTPDMTDTVSDLDFIKQQINSFISLYGADTIISIYEVPDWRTPAQADLSNYVSVTGGVASANALACGTWSIDTPTGFLKPDGTTFSPKNNKLYMYPYYYFVLTDNAGNEKEYRYEDFLNRTVQFDLEMSVTGTPALIAVPKSYKGVSKNYEEAIVLQTFVPCSWDCNVYEAWMAQHESSFNTGVITSMLGSIPQFANGTAVSTVRGSVGIINTILESIATVEDKKRVADKAMGCTNAEGLQTALNLDCFYCYKKQIKYGFADLIDGFFTAYGYARQRIKSPVITGRTYFNYLKTKGAKLVGSVPQEVMDKLVQIFDAGIQFWHLSNTVDSNMCNYSSLTNSIVT